MREIQIRALRKMFAAGADCIFVERVHKYDALLVGWYIAVRYGEVYEAMVVYPTAVPRWIEKGVVRVADGYNMQTMERFVLVPVVRRE